MSRVRFNEQTIELLEHTVSLSISKLPKVLRPSGFCLLMNDSLLKIYKKNKLSLKKRFNANNDTINDVTMLM